MIRSREVTPRLLLSFAPGGAYLILRPNYPPLKLKRRPIFGRPCGTVQPSIFEPYLARMPALRYFVTGPAPRDRGFEIGCWKQQYQLF